MKRFAVVNGHVVKKVRVIEVPAAFACKHTEPIKTQIDPEAPPEAEAEVRGRMEAAKGRAKSMPCLLCAHKQTVAEWTSALNGEAGPLRAHKLAQALERVDAILRDPAIGDDGDERCTQIAAVLASLEVKT